MSARADKKIVFLVSVFLFSVGSVFAQPERILLRLTSFEGKVTLFRNGQVMDLVDLEPGMDLGVFDLLETGNKGIALLEVFSPISIGTTIVLYENTAMYFEMSEKNRRQKMIINLLEGSFDIAIQAVTGAGEILVVTEFATLQINSMNSSIVLSPEGSLLILVKDGTVSCRTKRGEFLTAAPDVAVEQSVNQQLRGIPVQISNVANFKTEWVRQKVALFKPGSLKMLKSHAVAYIENLDKFNSAYVELIKFRDIFKRWEQPRGAGSSTGRSVAVRDKITVSPAVFKMKSSLAFIEHTYFRIVDLLTLYSRLTLDKGVIWPGFTTDDFFAEFSRKRGELAWKMAQVRYILKLYSSYLSIIVSFSYFLTFLAGKFIPPFFIIIFLYWCFCIEFEKTWL